MSIRDVLCWGLQSPETAALQVHRKLQERVDRLHPAARPDLLDTFNNDTLRETT